MHFGVTLFLELSAPSSSPVQVSLARSRVERDSKQIVNSFVHFHIDSVEIELETLHSCCCWQ